MKVTIVGLGETGVSVAALLIDRFSSVEMNVMDPADWISGRLLDIRHAAAMRNIRIHHNDYTAFAEADYIFFCAGIRNAKDGDRLSIVQDNKALIDLIFGPVRFTNKPFVIVVTNPVELIATWLHELKGGELTVLGTGTFLDTERYKYLLSRELEVEPIAVETIVAGEHGNSMVVFNSKTKISGRPVNELISNDRLEELKVELIRSAATIRKTEEATRYGVAQCAVEMLRYLEGSTPEPCVVSRAMTLEEQTLLGAEPPVFISLPVTLNNHSYTPVMLEGTEDNEVERLKDSLRVLGNVYNRVK